MDTFNYQTGKEYQTEAQANVKTLHVNQRGQKHPRERSDTDIT